MQTIADPVELFDSLGGLHDACVDWFAVDCDAAEIRLVINNLHAAFMDGDTPSPEYPGYAKRSATLVFSSVCSVSGHLNPAHGGMSVISELCVERHPAHCTVRLCGIDNWFWKFDFSHLTIDDEAEPPSAARLYQDYQGYLARTR